ncbi:uncharacterized oxidoreductase SSP0419-like [Globicephala melas]|uniref:uncharacterized oxidoreductase SSP0419-like n=1 Tax=Globicephala melas TaxID=9731 RepID=UPI00293D5B34|nr:uncharacterized oxidoreductase SSP0419-like [Globicephala melas]
MLERQKTALITGASNGIGKDFAGLFAKDGYQLVLVARSADKLEQIAQELKEQYQTEVLVIVQDLSLPDGAKQVYAKLKEDHIQIDVLVNNAGFGRVGDFANEDVEVMTEMINLNITSLTELTALVLPEMLERNSGKILNVASTAAFQALPTFSVYAATKAYVLSLTEALHYELKDTNIAVTALCPGPTSTGFAKRANAEALTLFKNVMSSQEVAQAGYDALMKNKMTLITGFTNKLLAFFTHIIPSRRLLISIVGRIAKL